MACIGRAINRRVLAASALNAVLGVQAIHERETLQNKEKSAIFASMREKSRLEMHTRGTSRGKQQGIAYCALRDGASTKRFPGARR